jgi:hypothetical protein
VGIVDPQGLNQGATAGQLGSFRLKGVALLTFSGGDIIIHGDLVARAATEAVGATVSHMGYKQVGTVHQGQHQGGTHAGSGRSLLLVIPLGNDVVGLQDGRVNFVSDRPRS